jgi:hypothetical protein
MSFQRMDADSAETLAGVVRLLRRAAELVWAAVDAEGAGSPGRCWRWALTWPPTRHGTCCRMPLLSEDLCRSEMNRRVSYAPPSSCCGASTPRERVPLCMACGYG